ncbi:MAG: DUF1080 domain-containing protein [Lentisphaerales bacterium]|nr:DUF1080 domain-containing protein [Lentisphaerales bacterium]
MKILFCLLLISLATYAEDLKPIFNGKDFTNWVKPKKNIWWSVEDGVIVCKNCPKKKGSNLWTTEKYKDFIVQLDFKMGEGIVDSGLFLRNQDQIQIGISGSLKRDMTTSPYIPGKGYPKESEGVKDILKVKGWNTMKVKAVNNVYTVWLNGTKVNEYESQTAIEEGPIGLQLHAKRIMEIHFKNIMVKKLN